MGIRIESNYRDVQRRLKFLEPEMRKALNKELRVAAKEVAATAKANASWSQQIPRAITTSVGVRGAAIKVRGPLGPLYERGSRGSRGSWRHPLFGHRDFWYAQQSRPFVEPAVRTHEAGVLADANREIEKTARRIGF